MAQMVVECARHPEGLKGILISGAKGKGKAVDFGQTVVEHDFIDPDGADRDDSDDDGDEK